MRLVVACDNCRRQYSTEEKHLGKRFRCRCGKTLTVCAPRPHDAAVVRCSSCGGPREEGTIRCGFCNSTFTLHERDLDSVCPECLTRVSRKAAYCHSCGRRILPEPLTTATTELACPACANQQMLVSRNMGEVSVMECDACTGLWLTNETFEHVTREAAKVAVTAERSIDRRLPEFERPRQPWAYRPCPHCEKLMARKNYGRKSGVIIDICRDHGLWFDAEELPVILNWIRSGGAAKANEALASEARQTARIKKGKVIGSRGPVSDYNLPREGRRDEFGIVSAGLSLIFDLFSGGGFE
jgi:Zn-finger nucleic acid-binding protein